VTVFVVQEVSGRNVLSARHYGDLKVLLPANANIMLSPAPTVRRLKDSLKNFSDEDYLLLMGDPAAIGLACVLASESNRGIYSILKWDRIESDYYPVKINIHQKGDSNVG